MDGHALSSGSKRPAEHARSWRLFTLVAAISVATMPLAAIWFLQLGFLALIATAVAATRRDGAEQHRILRTGGSVAAGLLVGPGVYLLLWVLPLP